MKKLLLPQLFLFPILLLFTGHVFAETTIEKDDLKTLKPNDIVMLGDGLFGNNTESEICTVEFNNISKGEFGLRCEKTSAGDCKRHSFKYEDFKLDFLHYLSKIDEEDIYSSLFGIPTMSEIRFGDVIMKASRYLAVAKFYLGPYSNEYVIAGQDSVSGCWNAPRRNFSRDQAEIGMGPISFMDLPLDGPQKGESVFVYEELGQDESPEIEFGRSSYHPTTVVAHSYVRGIPSPDQSYSHLNLPITSFEVVRSTYLLSRSLKSSRFVDSQFIFYDQGETDDTLGKYFLLELPEKKTFEKTARKITKVFSNKCMKGSCKKKYISVDNRGQALDNFSVPEAYEIYFDDEKSSSLELKVGDKIDGTEVISSERENVKNGLKTIVALSDNLRVYSDQSRERLQRYLSDNSIDFEHSFVIADDHSPYIVFQCNEATKNPDSPFGDPRLINLCRSDKIDDKLHAIPLDYATN